MSESSTPPPQSSEPAPSSDARAGTDAEVSAAKKALVRDIAVYTLFRIVLVVVIAGVLYGLGRLVTSEIPVIAVVLFAIVIALPLSMVLGRGLRARVSNNVAVIDRRRAARRDDFRRRLQGIDE